MGRLVNFLLERRQILGTRGCEQFVNRFAAAVQHGDLPPFAARSRAGKGHQRIELGLEFFTLLVNLLQQQID